MTQLEPGTDIRELMLDVARGRATSLDPAAKRLAILVMLNPSDVSVDASDLAGTGLVFLTDATESEMNDPVGRGGAPAITGYALSVAGVVTSEELTVDRHDLRDLTTDQCFVLRKLNPLDRSAHGASVLNFFQAAHDDSMSDVAAAIDEHRWTSGVWIERDRSQLSLTDELTGKDVFRLIDDDFGQAIEDGFLRTPRLPRPSDSEWHQPALDYAKSAGYMMDIELAPKASAHPMPDLVAPASAARSVERPRG